MQEGYKKVVIGAYFLFLGVALILGDGLQPIVDVIGVAVVVTLYGFLRIRGGDMYNIPWRLQAAWAGVFAAYGLSAVVSDSVAYSSSALVRLALGYLVFHVFASTGSKKTRKWYVRGVQTLTLVAIGVSGVAVALPQAASVLPRMNLLYATYGHNHLADVLVFAAPSILVVQSQRSVLKRTVLIGVYIAGLLTTLSRGAYLLIGGYVLHRAIRKRIMVHALLGIVLGGLAMAMILHPVIRQESAEKSGSFLGRQLNKPSPLEDARLQYWGQALEAVEERPIVGSGPGTFYLQSRRLQDTPQSYSWFAHSTPLQTMVETGLVGVVASSVLAVVVARGVWQTGRTMRKKHARHYKEVWAPLAQGVLLLVIYSMYEFALSFLVLWVLLWSSVGILLGTDKSKRINKRGEFTVGLVVVLMYYYVFSLIGSFYEIQTKRVWFPSTLLSVQAASRFLETSEEISPQQKSVLLSIHHKNPEVLRSASLAMSIPQEERLQYLIQAIAYAPKSASWHVELLRTHKETGSWAAFGQALEAYVRAFVPEETRPVVDGIVFDSNDMVALYRQGYGAPLFLGHKPPIGLSKTLYAFGLAMIEDAPETTRLLWRTARDLSPAWSYFYIEGASLEEHVFGNSGGASTILDQCIRHEAAREHCDKARQEGIPIPGSLESSIQRMPSIVHGL